MLAPVLWGVPSVCCVAAEVVRRYEEGGRREGRRRTLMMSRLSRVCHLARGRSVKVISSVSSCAGVLNTLVGSVIEREARASSSGGNRVTEEATGVWRKRDRTFFLGCTLH